MKSFAVILAAIAALAATAQAYLIWKAQDSHLEVAGVQSERISGCKQLIGGLARFERLTANSDDFVNDLIAQFEKARMEHPEEFANEPPLTAEGARQTAERQFLYWFLSPAYELQQFTDVYAIFFGDAELAEFGIEDIENAVGRIDRYSGSFTHDAVSFDERLSLFAKAASHLPSARAVCSRIIGV